MYTEVKELVNFLCRYAHGHLPRRATGLFGAELGNFLVSQFSASWDLKNPVNGEKDRILVVNCPEGSSQCFNLAAIEAGLDVVELLDTMPLNLRIWTNPGSVFFRVGDQAISNSIAVPIFVGDINKDENYQPMPEYIVRAAGGCAEKLTTSNLGAAGQPYQPTRKPVNSSYKTIMEVINGMYTPLGLEESDELNPNLCHLQTMYPYRFYFKPPYSQTYTGLEFSQTRFGSTKPRPDLQTMDGIKQLINDAMNEAEAEAESPPSPMEPEHFFNMCKI